MSATTKFTNRKTPCGRRMNGNEYEDHDAEVILRHETVFGCGCRVTRQEYHDGAVSRTIIRHDGLVLVEELLSAQ